MKLAAENDPEIYKDGKSSINAPTPRRKWKNIIGVYTSSPWQQWQSAWSCVWRPLRNKSVAPLRRMQRAGSFLRRKSQILPAKIMFQGTKWMLICIMPPDAKGICSILMKGEKGGKCGHVIKFHFKNEGRPEAGFLKTQRSNKWASYYWKVGQMSWGLSYKMWR